MIMVGSATNPTMAPLQKTPAEVGGIGTQSPYVVIPDPDAHHARAVAAGAEIIRPVHDEDYGGRHYACRDPEGHLWHFGSYDPWAH